MEHRIENPYEWEGQEVEAILATHSGQDGEKELCLVSVVRIEGPAAFYRVRERGEAPAEFENWLEAVNYYNCIGEDLFCAISGEICEYKPGESKERPCKTLCSIGKEWLRKSRDIKCIGHMFREDGRLTYGAMCCEECEAMKICRMLSERKGE